MNIVSSLHPWDESHLIMVYDLFDVLLDAFCQYFVEDFSIYTHQLYGPVVLFSCFVSMWFLNYDSSGLITRVWEVFPCLGYFGIV